METNKKLADLLDKSESHLDGTNPAASDTDAIGNIIKGLSRSELENVIRSLSSKVDMPAYIKDALETTYDSAPMQIDPIQQQPTTGIELLDEKQPYVDDDISPALDDEYYVRIAKYAPIRLSLEERKIMRLLDSTLHVSEYTDKIDILHDGNKNKKIVKEIKEVCAILSGLAISRNYDEGRRLVTDRNYVANAQFFRNVFEIGRRYKILNPDKMRSSYGKLMYFLMDSRRPEIQELLDFDCVAPVNTVYSFLSTKTNGLEMLKDPQIGLATMEITPEGKSRNQVQCEIKAKEDAIRYMTSKYGTKNKGIVGLGLSFFAKSFGVSQQQQGQEEEMTRDEVQACLYSLGDHHSHLRAFRHPCDVMIKHLKENFDPKDPNPKYNLGIVAGMEGSRLSHSHSRQYMYVLQSLTLWREIAHDMFALWHFAEADLLNPDNTYRLRNTGQGLNRIQDGPNVVNGMRHILRRVQHRVGTWVGSNVIHLGDHNVPNSFIFIEKYTQIPRILNPIVMCLEKLPELYKSTASMKKYIDTEFNGLSQLKMLILTDFFRLAFDGSGADNFNDAGSCIDGRLTSAWNWCSKIEKKSFFPIFLLTGFSGFDGRFSED
ncbi:Protein of unknown function DUF2009 [Babesia duncani]|uniref:Non-canonical E2 ubiquitin-conjugating enzyme C-terminal domain-containing protein n=1 Tax=Babesia duncani TaxID=323732 RepID=A0AAD9PKJ4_9APIC|nr:Protein of unknown function DUF2009 [Babesia duncani]